MNLDAYSQLQARIRLQSIPALDGIRAIAVLLVLFFHLSKVRPLPALPGPLGVLGFFVLSGFLITWLLLKEREKSGSISLKGFYKRRALRIFPAFYVFWILAVGSRWMVHGMGDVPWSQAFSAFFYVSNYFHAILHPSPDFILHTWSLSAEEQFYLLWPLTFLLFSKKTRHLMFGLAAMIGAIWIHRGHLWMSGHEGYYITYAFDTRADALLVGCLLALMLNEGLCQGVFDRVCRTVWAPLLTCLLIGTSVYVGSISEGYKLVGGLAIEPVLVAILICQWVVQSESLPWKWLNSKPAAYLGRISYALYLYHMLATHLATRIVARIPGQNTALFVIIAVLTAIVISSCSYYIVEKPFLKLKARGAAAVKAEKIPLAPRQESLPASRPTATPAS